MSDSDVTLTTIRADLVELPALELRAVSPPELRVTVPLALAPVVVGSDPSADVVLRDERASRRHCELSLTDQGIVIRDLRSKNGTFVRGVRIREALLPVGEVAQLGDSQLSVHVSGPPTRIELASAASFGDALGATVAMRALFAKLERAAASDETVLLIGESGTGKELLASAIHARSPRREEPFVVFDCSSVAENLIEAELFGHEKGSFTGAVSDRAGLLESSTGGTVFIDEIGELPLHLQPTLLRAIESRQLRRVGGNQWLPFDARIVAATHRDLRALVADGKFRQDLYYRLCVVDVTIPPLRERKQDIPLLVERLLASLVPPRMLDDLPPGSLDLLQAHDWPGNVRELRNTVTRLVLFPDLMDEAIGAPAAPAGPSRVPEQLLQLPWKQAREMALEQFEKAYLSAVLNRHGGRVASAAKAMGVSRQFVYMLMDRHGLR